MRFILLSLLWIAVAAAVEPLRWAGPDDARSGGILVAEAEGLLDGLPLLRVDPAGLRALDQGTVDAVLVGDEILSAWAAGQRPVLLAISHGPGVIEVVAPEGGGEPWNRVVSDLPRWPGQPAASLRLAAQVSGREACLGGRKGGDLTDFIAGRLPLWPATWRHRAQLAELGVRTHPILTATDGFQLALVCSSSAWSTRREDCLRLRDGFVAGWRAARDQPAVLMRVLAAQSPGIAQGTLLREAEAALAGLRPQQMPVFDELRHLAGILEAAGIPAAIPSGALGEDPVVVEGTSVGGILVLCAVVLALVAAILAQVRTMRRLPIDTKLSETQRHMLSDLLDLEGWELALHFRPQAQVSGDFYLCTHLADGRALLVVGDVSGHGFNAALVMAAVHKAGELLAAQHAALTAWLIALDRAIAPDLPRGFFVTLVAVALDPHSGAIECSRAGHPPAWVLDGEDGSWVEAGPVGPALGLGSRDDFAARIGSSRIHLRPGSDLLLFTDGLTEIFDRAGNEYGESGLRASVLRHRHREVQEFVDALATDAVSHARRAPDDDLTALVLRRIRATVGACASA